MNRASTVTNVNVHVVEPTPVVAGEFLGVHAITFGGLTIFFAIEDPGERAKFLDDLINELQPIRARALNAAAAAKP